MEKGAVLLFYWLAKFYLLISINFFLHPLKTLPYPLDFGSWHCPSADGGRICELNIPPPPTITGPWDLLSQGQEMAKDDFSIRSNYSSSWIWLGR